MDITKKNALMKKIKTFATMAGKLNVLSSNVQQVKQDEKESENIMNLEIEKGIAQEKFFNAIQRKNKTESDAKNIQDYESINKLFGKDTEPNAKIMLCKGMQLETYQKGQPIIKQNEPSNNKFYVIASGSVVIVKAVDTNVFQLVQKEDDKNVQNVPDNKQTSLSSLTNIEKQSRRISTLNVKKEKEPEDQLKIEIQKYGKEINTLKLGQGFGEAAITETDPKKAKRGATILACEENTQLIIIMKRDFQKFKDTFSSQGKEKAQILSKLIPQLKQINSTQTRDDLIFYFQEEGGLRGQTLTVEDRPGDKVYVLKEGQVQIEKNYVNEKNIYYRDVQKIKISAVSDHSFLGEEILQSNDESLKYNYTITISSIQARYYSVKKSILLNKYPNLIKDILNEYELKEKHRKNTVDYILSKNQQPSNMIQVGDTLHEYNKLKNIDLFSQMKISMVEIHNKNAFKDVIKNEKMQTAEDIAKIRQGIMREFEEKPKYKQSSQTQIQVPEETVGLSLNKKRPTTSQIRYQSQVQQQKNSSNEVEDLKFSFQFKLNNSESSAPFLKNQQLFDNSNQNTEHKNSALKQNQQSLINLNPVYSKTYQNHHDSEDNFMENLQEKLKLMTKVQQNPKDTPQLDLGYLEQFKKKQQLKLLVKQKPVHKTSELCNNRMTIMQKKIDQIKNKYLKGNNEQDIIVQDGFQIQNTNSNNLFNSQLFKSYSENTPKNTSHTNDSQSTPLSSKGLKGTRKSNQAINPIKFSSFKKEVMPSSRNSQIPGFIIQTSSLSNFAQIQSPSPSQNYHQIVTQSSSIPSLFVINSQRELTQNESHSMIMNTPQNIRSFSNTNILLSQKNINFTNITQNSKFRQSETQLQENNQINEGQNSSDSLYSDQIPNNYIVPKSSPLKIKQQIHNSENLYFSNSAEETNEQNSNFNSRFSQNNIKTQESNKLQNHSLQDFNFDKNQRGIQVQTNFSSFYKKDLNNPLSMTPSAEKPLKFGSNYFLDQKRCLTSIDLKKKSLLRQKLKTGLSFQQKNSVQNQIF